MAYQCYCQALLDNAGATCNDCRLHSAVSLRISMKQGEGESMLAMGSANCG
jgi:hypothetical protein